MPKGLSVIEHNGVLLAKLYKTLIVDFETVPKFNTRVLKLDTGGWKTAHTKKCINLVLKEYGISVRQSKGQWYVYHNDTVLGTFDDSFKIGIPA